MNKNILRYTLRVDKDLFQKYKYVAKYYNRSANKQIEQYIKLTVKNFEEKCGEIKV